MIAVNEQVIQQLLEPQYGLCISIFMPTAIAGPDTAQGPVRLKNLLGAAEQRLADWGTRRSEAATLLDPAAELIDNSEFWRHQGAGLAMWLSGEGQWRSSL